jgi:hypothetical protein
MTQSRVPLTSADNISSFTVRVLLTGVEFILSFQYNQRDSSWWLSLYDALREPIIEGVKCVVGLPLLRNTVDARRPAGELVFLDLTKKDLDPGLLDLGERIALIYADNT